MNRKNNESFYKSDFNLFLKDISHNDRNLGTYHRNYRELVSEGVKMTSIDWAEVLGIMRWIGRNLKTYSNYRTTEICSSYTLKHVVENDLGIYVTNETFIAAAFFSTGVMRKTHQNSPNFYFCFTESSIKNTQERIKRQTEIDLFEELSRVYSKRNKNRMLSSTSVNAKNAKQLMGEI